MVDATYRFCNVQLDARSGELLGSDGVAHVLGAKPYELLLYLLLHAGRTVPREELLQAVWTDTTVSDGSLSTAIRQVRRALQTAGCDEDVIRTVSRRGYRLVARVQVHGHDAAPASVGAGHSSLPAPEDVTLFGRDALMGEVEHWLALAQAGQPSVVYLQGGPGLGKSAMAEQVAARARALGFTTSCVRCQGAAGAPALWPIVQLLRRLATELGETLSSDSALSSDSERPRPTHELAGLLARFGVYFAEEPDLEPASARFLRFDAVARALSEAARLRPLCVVFDDLHTADASSRELVEHVAALVEGPVSILSTVTSGHAPTEAPPSRHVRTLEPLSETAAQALLAAADKDGQLPEADRNALLAAAAGHPLLLLELLRSQLKGSGLPGRGAAEEAIAATLKRVMQQRFERLSPVCRRLLAVAACHGHEFSSRRLATLGDVSRSAQQAALAEACGAEVLAEVEGAVERYRFAQPQFRTLVYEGMAPAERAAIHTRIAEQLDAEALPEEDVAAALLHHHQAGRGGPRAIAFAGKAAFQAGRLGAHATAQEHLAQASNLRVVDGETRAELLLQSATARAALGAGAAELRGLYDQAFNAAKRSGAAELAARAALGYVGCRMLRGAPVNAAPPQRGELSRLREALDMQPTSSVTRVLLQARLGLALTATERLEEGVRLTGESVTAAEALRDPRTLCHALLQRARSLSAPGESGRRIAVAEEARVLAASAGLGALERDAAHESVVARLRADRVSRAELEQLAAREQAPDPTERIRSVAGRLLLLIMRGEIEAAEQTLQSILPLARCVNPIVAETMEGTYRWEIDRLRGQQTSLHSLRAVDAVQYKPEPWMGYIWLFALLDQGHRRSARLVYDTLLRGLSKVTPNLFFLPAMGVAAWAAYLFSDERGGREIHECLLPYESENVVSAGGLLYHYPVAHSLGVAALAAGDLEQAEAHFLSAEQRAAASALDALRHQITASGLNGLLNDFPPSSAPSGASARRLASSGSLH